MIINELSTGELRALLAPFFHFSPQSQRDDVARKILQYEFVSYSELYDQTKIRFMYKRFSFTVNIRRTEIYLIFTAPRNWLPSVWLQGREVIGDLKSMCKDELPGLHFDTVVTEVPRGVSGSGGEIIMTHLIDGRGVNMREARKNPWVSPTVIAYYAIKGECRVELVFQSAAYQREREDDQRII